MKILIKINFPIPSLYLRKGDVFNIDTDEDRVPIEKFWRDRLKDAAIDNCIEVVKSEELTLLELANLSESVELENKESENIDEVGVVEKESKKRGKK